MYGRIASSSVASGGVASGGVASGGVASGSVASGSVASGSVASGSVASGSGALALATVACRATPPPPALDLAAAGRGTNGDAKELPTPWAGATSKSAAANKGCGAWPVIGSSRRGRGKRAGPIGVGRRWTGGRRHKSVRRQTDERKSMTAQTRAAQTRAAQTRAAQTRAAQTRAAQTRAGLWVQPVAGAM
ncbi:MAG: hypothetical protein EXR77_15825 [Myxococcales bacterium]|nr:hypothetical protein [Myxococcales bacterium]